MDGAPHNGDPDNKLTDKRVASGRPAGAGHVRFGEGAEQLFENGYEPLPIRAGSKAPAATRWSSVVIDEGLVSTWGERHPDCGIGLRTGGLVGIDIDVTDPDRAHEIMAMAVARFGVAPMRVGLWPKRLLLYRTEASFTKLSSGGVEVLGQGQQFVAFGIHPVTGQAYYWPYGETPLELPRRELPVVDRDGIETFLGEVAATTPPIGKADEVKRRQARLDTPVETAPVRAAGGLVIDGRDGWLSQIAFHAVHDALNLGPEPHAEIIADKVWARFSGTTDLDRPRKSGRRPYGPEDALAKVRDKLRLHRDGRLPARARDEPEHVLPDGAEDAQPVAEARLALDAAIAAFAGKVEEWLLAEPFMGAPRLGLQATVGLGKSVTARRHLLDLQARLKDRKLPHRILYLTPSHALAEECALAWREVTPHVAVLRGYERKEPASGRPMCRDLDAVRIAIAAGEPVPPRACKSSGKHECRYLSGCLKQKNLLDVGVAEVILAPYDMLFVKSPVPETEFAVVVVDEACWPRGLDHDSELDVDALLTTCAPPCDVLRALHDLLSEEAAGPVSRAALCNAGLEARACLDAHVRLITENSEITIGLYPGASKSVKRKAKGKAKLLRQRRRVMTLLGLFYEFLSGDADFCPNVVLGEENAESGRRSVHLYKPRAMLDGLLSRPLLHLDATMREDLVKQSLGQMEIRRIEATAPHMSVELVFGKFAKTNIVPRPEENDDDEGQQRNRSRERRLQALVDHVRWQARRVAPGRTLVITYKAIEDRFAGIANVETAHFNAIAGLDCYKEVAQLIVIGRPLPRDAELANMAGAWFGHVIGGGYQQVLCQVPLQDGSMAAAYAIRHSDPRAEVLRAAICDDEVIQAIGRGRGVNRTAETPLKVQVLADVVLPLRHDRIRSWESLAPDLMQRMLLSGVAVDSPADAAALHPERFRNPEQAKKALAGLFKGKSPIRTYKGISLKSAAYRRPGRGRGWQTAWWIEGDAEAARAKLEAAVGEVEDWVVQGG